MFGAPCLEHRIDAPCWCLEFEPRVGASSSCLNSILVPCVGTPCLEPCIFTLCWCLVLVPTSGTLCWCPHLEPCVGAHVGASGLSPTLEPRVRAHMGSLCSCPMLEPHVWHPLMVPCVDSLSWCLMLVPVLVLHVGIQCWEPCAGVQCLEPCVGAHV